MKAHGIPGSTAGIGSVQPHPDPMDATGPDAPFGLGVGTVAAPRVCIPIVAASVDSIGQADRTASATLARNARDLSNMTQAGAPAHRVADAATALFDGLQGRTLAAPDANEIMSSLGQAGAHMRQSEHYAQSTVIPPDQSEAEGQIARSRDIVDLALRAPRS